MAMLCFKTAHRGSLHTKKSSKSCITGLLSFPGRLHLTFSSTPGLSLSRICTRQGSECEVSETEQTMVEKGGGGQEGGFWGGEVILGT